MGKMETIEPNQNVSCFVGLAARLQFFRCAAFTTATFLAAPSSQRLNAPGIAERMPSLNHTEAFFLFTAEY